MSRAMIILNTQADRDKACKWAQGVPMGSRIEFKETKRSIPQNDRFWALLTEIADHMRPLGRDYPPENWKIIFMAAYGHEVKFLPSLDQKTFIPVGHSSSDLSVREMSDLMEFMSAWAAENGIALNDHKSPDTDADSATASDQEADDVDPPSSSSASHFLVRFARDVFTMAMDPETTGATFGAVMKRWHSETEKLAPADQEKAKQIGASAKRLFNDAGLYEGIVEHYAEMLGCDQSALQSE